MAIEVGQGITDWMKNWGTLNLTTVATYEWGEVGVHASAINYWSWAWWLSGVTSGSF
jgi:hypothetical protein